MTLYPQCKNHPNRSDEENFSAIPMAFSKSSSVRAFSLRKVDFAFDHEFSHGLKSGLYLGKNHTSAPFSYIDISLEKQLKKHII